MNCLRVTMITALLGIQISVHAATFCVSNSTMLETVLDVTESNGQHDEIKIVNGAYIPLNSYGFRFYLGEDYNLIISGGWNTGCSEQTLNPLNTVLDGDDSNRVISFYTTQNSPTITAHISLSNLSVNNGLYHEQGSTIYKTSGLGFDLNQSHEGSITIDRLFFMGNRSNNSSSLRAAGNKMTVKNSLFFNNESDYGSISSVADNFYFINNTVINNTYYTQFNGGDSRSGLLLSQYSEKVFLANNLFWDNYNHDVSAGSNSTNNPVYYLYHNNYQSKSGIYDFESGNLSVDPQLGLLNFEPDISSPLVDSGYHNPLPIPFPPPFENAWSFGDQDFTGLDRVVNNRVDIGAVEALPELPIFINGFERTRGG